MEPHVGHEGVSAVEGRWVDPALGYSALGPGVNLSGIRQLRWGLLWGLAACGAEMARPGSSTPGDPPGLGDTDPPVDTERFVESGRDDTDLFGDSDRGADTDMPHSDGSADTVGVPVDTGAPVGPTGLLDSAAHDTLAPAHSGLESGSPWAPDSAADTVPWGESGGDSDTYLGWDSDAVDTVSLHTGQVWDTAADTARWDTAADTAHLVVRVPSVAALRGGAATYGDWVRVPEVVVTGVHGNGSAFAQDPAALQDGGIYVFGAAPGALRPGDRVALEGLYLDYYGIDEIDVTQGRAQVLRGGAVPTPLPVPLQALSQSAMARAYEGMLIEVDTTGPLVVDALLPYDEVRLAVGPHTLLMDDFLFNARAALGLQPGMGVQRLVGNLNYSFGAYKVAPRSAVDVDVAVQHTGQTVVVATVRELHQGTVAVGQLVQLSGLVVTASNSVDLAFVQDPTQGSEAGLRVVGAALNPGDVVSVEGVPQQVDGLLEVDLTQQGNVLATGLGVSVAPAALSVDQLGDPALLSAYAGMLIDVTSAGPLDVVDLPTGGEVWLSPVDTHRFVVVGPTLHDASPGRVVGDALLGVVGVLQSTAQGWSVLPRNAQDVGPMVPSGAHTGAPWNGELLLSEVCDPDTDPSARFIELYNGSSAVADLRNYRLGRSTDGLSYTTVPLEGFLHPGATMVVAFDSAAFANTFPGSTYVPFQSALVSGNGNDAYTLETAAGVRVDAYGEVGVDGLGTVWDYTDACVERLGVVASPHHVAAQWAVPAAVSAGAGSPGTHP